MLFRPVKMTLKSIKSVETVIITCMGLDTLPNLCLLQAVQLQVQGQWTRWMNYIQQDFSWASLKSMPASLTSFCLVSTYDTLSSPANLKRWRITTETMCTLCNKDVRTTAHISGACKVSLQQGRYTFRQDSLA